MRTPYEVLYGKKPYVGNLQLFGALTYVYVPPGTRAADIRPPPRLQKMAPAPSEACSWGTRVRRSGEYICWSKSGPKECDTVRHFLGSIATGY